MDNHFYSLWAIIFQWDCWVIGSCSLFLQETFRLLNNMIVSVISPLQCVWLFYVLNNGWFCLSPKTNRYSIYWCPWCFNVTFSVLLSLTQCWNKSELPRESQFQLQWSLSSWNKYRCLPPWSQVSRAAICSLIYWTIRYIQKSWCLQSVLLCIIAFSIYNIVFIFWSFCL